MCVCVCLAVLSLSCGTQGLIFVISCGIFSYGTGLMTAVHQTTLLPRGENLLEHLMFFPVTSTS